MTVDASTLLIDGPWRHRFVPANGARFHVALAGPDDNDAPLVVLLHGMPEFWWAWRHQLPVLAAAGYRVAAMDLRGTSYPCGGGGEIAWAMPAIAPDVTHAIAALGSPHPLQSRSEPLGALRLRAARHLAFFQLPSLPERALTTSDLVVRLLREWGARGWTTPEIEDMY